MVHSDEAGAQDPDSGPIAEPAAPTPVVRKRGRRVTTDPVPGTDPAPAPVDRRVDSHDNDQRLKADKPPHW
ncbi:hypothetical protein AX769_07720 [Frondihabitans sp. PAMC 28766]|uniref:hypothetical protein n=1 Tax=Frondihabitans sp. PAMC 28766 TaxID=1795630 RepID=UPI00078B7837|nr:hypothetical protein [Frondihabitans sp. PAMC 28766]AMM20072.1 hypothetical protein AX769_07720 [Frondihabitans sp. PAMC 28766]